MHGNHDPANGWSAGLALPESVHVFPTDRVGRFEVVVDGEVVAAVYGRSFARAAELENLALGYSRQPGDPVAIGVLHANIGSTAGYDPYAPATLEDLRARAWTTGRSATSTSRTSCRRDPVGRLPGQSAGAQPQGDRAARLHGRRAGPRRRRRRRSRSRRRPSDGPRSTATCRGPRASRRSARFSAEACDAVRAEQNRPCVVRVTLVGRTRRCTANSLDRGCWPSSPTTCAVSSRRGSPWVWLDRADRHHLGDARSRCRQGRRGVLGGAGQHRRRAGRGLRTSCRRSSTS